MTLNYFWQVIENAWNAVPAIDEKRKKAVTNNNYATLEQLESPLYGAVLNAYTVELNKLSKEQLTAFIHHLEERLYHIDRAEIQHYTDGSDDGFLYARCFILAMGEIYYNNVDQQPDKAAVDLESESFGFAAYGVYEDRFGEEFDRAQYYCIESCSNAAAW